MTKAELVEDVARAAELTKKDAERLVEIVFESIIETLNQGEKIELRGFCSFCELQSDPGRDVANFVIYRGSYSYLVLNLYPYATGHVLIVPYAHVANLDAADKETTDEMMDLTK